MNATVILLVEDHRIVRTVVREALASVCPSVTIVVAVTGAEAIAKSREHHPQIVVMDGRLPDMSGTDATKHIRGILPQAKIVFFTLVDDEPARTAAISCGTVAFVSKREGVETLIRVVGEWL